MDAGLAELTAKLDQLISDVALLRAQAEAAEARQAARDELLEELTPIGQQALRLATEQLQALGPDANREDLLWFGTRILRSRGAMEWALDQLDSAADLGPAVQPIVGAAMDRATDALGEAERRGYLAFALESWKILDNIVANFTQEDVAKLGDNIVLILNTIKDMTQPEIMGFVRNTVQNVEGQAELPVDIAYRSLFAQMRDPDVRRGLAMTMRVLSTVGSQTSEPALHENSDAVHRERTS